MSDPLPLSLELAREIRDQTEGRCWLITEPETAAIIDARIRPLVDALGKIRNTVFSDDALGAQPDDDEPVTIQDVCLGIVRARLDNIYAALKAAGEP